MSKVTLKAGKYYVGDLCYVIAESDWLRFCDEVFCHNKPQIRDFPNSFKFNNCDGFVSSTFYGDGTYYDEYGNEYDVDSGTLGCYPVNGLDKNTLDDVVSKQSGKVFEFLEDFDCYSRSGEIYIGHVVIDTVEDNDSYTDEYYDDNHDCTIIWPNESRSAHLTSNNDEVEYCIDFDDDPEC